MVIQTGSGAIYTLPPGEDLTLEDLAAAKAHLERRERGRNEWIVIRAGTVIGRVYGDCGECAQIEATRRYVNDFVLAVEVLGPFRGGCARRTP